jgi:ribosomal protein S15P/S13E
VSTRIKFNIVNFTKRKSLYTIVSRINRVWKYISKKPISSGKLVEKTLNMEVLK